MRSICIRLLYAQFKINYSDDIVVHSHMMFANTTACILIIKNKDYILRFLNGGVGPEIEQKLYYLIYQSFNTIPHVTLYIYPT